MLARKAYCFLFLADQGSHAASLHESMAKLYPAEQPLSAQVTSIAARSAAFREGSAEATAAMKESLEAALAAFLAKRNEVNKMVDERASVRQEIIHYQEKIAQLEPKAAANPKDAQKLDENKKKLEEVRQQEALYNSRQGRHLCRTPPCLCLQLLTV